VGVRIEKIVSYVKERRGEHQLHFIETFRDAETKVVGYERRVSFKENHRFQSDTKIKKKVT
jgi:hypothetical protein